MSYDIRRFFLKNRRAKDAAAMSQKAVSKVQFYRRQNSILINIFNKIGCDNFGTTLAF